MSFETISVISTALGTFSSLGLLVVNLTLAARINELKVYMHEKFMTKEDAKKHHETR